MRITILMGSPNSEGSTAMLVEQFIKGAEESGHICEMIDVCHANIHPCTGCVRCGYEGPCVQKDDVETIRGKLLASDMVVFSTPLYYYLAIVLKESGKVIGELFGHPEGTKPEDETMDTFSPCWMLNLK